MPAHCDVAPPLAYGRAELEPTSASETEVARAGECVTGLVGMRNANLIREMTTNKGHGQAPKDVGGKVLRNSFNETRAEVAQIAIGGAVGA
jgi:hypothetical protein